MLNRRLVLQQLTSAVAVAGLAGCVGDESTPDSDTGSGGDGAGNPAQSDQSNGTDDSTDSSDDSSDSEYSTDSGVKLAITRTEPTAEVILDEDPLISRDGSHILLVQLSAQNTTDTKVQLPTPSRFTLDVETETKEPYQIVFQDDPNGVASTLSEPVSGAFFPPTAELPPERTTTGWLLFSVPVDSSEATFQLRDSDGGVLNDWALSYDTTA